MSVWFFYIFIYSYVYFALFIYFAYVECIEKGDRMFPFYYYFGVVHVNRNAFLRLCLIINGVGIISLQILLLFFYLATRSRIAFTVFEN